MSMITAFFILIPLLILILPLFVFVILAAAHTRPLWGRWDFSGGVYSTDTRPLWGRVGCCCVLPTVISPLRGFGACALSWRGIVSRAYRSSWFTTMMRRLRALDALSIPRRAPIFVGTHSGFFLEQGAEVLRILKAERKGDFAYSVV